MPPDGSPGAGCRQRLRQRPPGKPPCRRQAARAVCEAIPPPVRCAHAPPSPGGPPPAGQTAGRSSWRAEQGVQQGKRVRRAFCSVCTHEQAGAHTSFPSACSSLRRVSNSGVGTTPVMRNGDTGRTVCAGMFSEGLTTNPTGDYTHGSAPAPHELCTHVRMPSNVLHCFWRREENLLGPASRASLNRVAEHLVVHSAGGCPDGGACTTLHLARIGAARLCPFTSLFVDPPSTQRDAVYPGLAATACCEPRSPAWWTAIAHASKRGHTRLSQ